MKQKFTILLILSVFAALFSFSQNTYVPDDNFEQALIDLGYDTPPLNDSVPTANISNVESLTIDRKDIADLTGISSFTSLEGLSCVNNKLTSLDISANTQLKRLYCGINRISELDVSGNTKLYYLSFARNLISQIDLTKNINLSTLSCPDNTLKTLNINANKELRILYCNDNQIDSLDVSNNSVLTKLWCDNNQLATLNLTANTSLTELRCYTNQLTSLDISANTGLTFLHCSDNKLNTLNIKNGENEKITDFDATNNPELTCIQVDDPGAALTNTNWKKDAGASYSENCTTSSHIDVVSAYIKIFPNPVNNHLYIQIPPDMKTHLIKTKIYNAYGKLIQKQDLDKNFGVINLAGLPHGVYLVKLWQDDKLIRSSRIIKQ